jgi:hypothetical protein
MSVTGADPGDRRSRGLVGRELRPCATVVELSHSRHSRPPSRPRPPRASEGLRGPSKAGNREISRFPVRLAAFRGAVERPRRQEPGDAAVSCSAGRLRAPRCRSASRAPRRPSPPLAPPRRIMTSPCHPARAADADAPGRWRYRFPQPGGRRGGSAMPQGADPLQRLEPVLGGDLPHEQPGGLLDRPGHRRVDREGWASWLTVSRLCTATLSGWMRSLARAATTEPPRIVPEPSIAWILTKPSVHSAIFARGLPVKGRQIVWTGICAVSASSAVMPTAATSGSVKMQAATASQRSGATA